MMFIFENEDFDLIKAIRKPRKGSKDARGIVAIAAKEYRRFLNDNLRAHLKFKAACLAIRAVHKEPSSIRWMIYQKQKSMLK